MNSNDSNYDPNSNSETSQRFGSEQSGTHQLEMTTSSDDLMAEHSRPRGLTMGGWIAWTIVVLLTFWMVNLVASSKAPTGDPYLAPSATGAEMAQVELQGKVLVAQKLMTQKSPSKIAENPEVDTDAEDSENSDETMKDDESTADVTAANRSAAQSDNENKEAASDSSGQPATQPAVAEVTIPDELDVGPYEQRLCYTILTNELRGPVAALEHLKKTDQRVNSVVVTAPDSAQPEPADEANATTGTPAATDANEPTEATTSNDATELNQKKFSLNEDQTRLRSIVKQLLENYQTDNFDTELVAAEDQQFLIEKLGWYGDLILAPPGTPNKELRTAVTGVATKSLFTMMGAMLTGLLVALIGLVIVILFITLVAMGRLRSRFAHHTDRHNIYIETFAIWMVIFFLGQIPFGYFLQSIGITDEVTEMGFSLILFFGSLICLVWPVLRGIPFSVVRQDIGWTFPNPFIEGGVAGVVYTALVPAIGIAVISFIVLMTLFGPKQSPEDFSNSAAPSHPVQEYLADGNLAVFGLVLVLASVAAPIVEETMFRGVLYRHLRDLSAARQFWVSVVLSTLINSFIFAAIHPQGLLGIPLLMTLAIGFSLAREWRGSLMAPMMMHALSNFLVTTFSFVAM